MEENTRRSTGGGSRRLVERPAPVLEWLWWAVVLGMAFVWACSRLDVPERVLDRRVSANPPRSTEVLPRDAWKAAPPTRIPGDLGPVRWITVHHEGGGVRADAGLDSTARILRGIQRYHMEQHETKPAWIDIGYHFVVDRAGRVWEGRPAEWVGAHAGSAAANRGNLGVMVLGNFDKQEPTAAQLAGLRRLLESLRVRHDIDRASVLGHDECRARSGLRGTRCPGVHLRRWLHRYRAEPLAPSSSRA